MNDSEMMPVEANESNSIVRDQLKSMTNLIYGGLAAMILLSGSINFLLLWQVVAVTREQKSQREGATKMLKDYEEISKPMIKDFVRDLQEYAKTHPAFAEILSRYVQASKPNAPTSLPAGGQSEGSPR